MRGIGQDQAQIQIEIGLEALSIGSMIILQGMSD